MDLVSLCPLPAWGFVWQSTDGRHAQTVVVKATFKLAPGKVTLAEEQDAANEEDGYWNDDPTRSIVTPSDKAPYKPHADVLLVGHAYAPNKQPVRSLVVRLTVGDLDKSIEVFCERAFRMQDGALREGQPFTKSRLSWERAAGGPGTTNPIGIRLDGPPGPYGIVSLPSLQPPGIFVSQRSDVFPPVCFGPIGPTWPGRVEHRGPLAGSFPKPGWTEVPLPELLDPLFFQAAPPDQQVREIRPNERIILENLLPDHPRLVTSLPGLRPRAFVDRATGEREEVAFVADTLLIDTDRAVCVVVWRGRIGLRHAQEAGRISVAMSEETEASPAPVLPRVSMGTIPAIDEVEAEDDHDAGLTTLVPPNETARAPSQPLAGTGTHPPRGDAVMSFVRTDQSRAPASPSALPWPMSAGPATPLPVAPPMGPPAMAPPGTVVPPLVGAPAPPKAAGPPSSNKLAAPPPTPSAPVSPAANKFARPVSNEVLDLLWYEDSFVPRIRANWEELVSGLVLDPADLRKDLHVEGPEKARARQNIFGILSDGEMVEPSGISRLVNETVDQRGRFNPPLALTGGELRFPFDEVETLKATIVAMTPILGSDKRLKETVDGMVELLKAPYLQGSTGIVDKFIQDLRAQVRESNRTLSATYLDGPVERLLVEQRRYVIRKVFGGEFIRALLTAHVPDGYAKGSDVSIPVYVPKSLDQTLPMLPAMKVRLIVECHLQQDPHDSSPYALRTVALVRSYPLEALRSGAKA